jgi:DNA (cytosine-5)-methyltransferase 1
MAKEQAVETLGQSIDYKLHHEIVSSIRQHIEDNLGQGPVVRHSHQASLI